MNRTGQFEQLFNGYWTRYIGQIPAQAFDKVNENFIRTTFYELCNRYLFYHFIFSIEVNHPSGRSDGEAIGRPEKGFKNQILVIEFKHFNKAEGKNLGVLKRDAPQPEELEQVTNYAADIQNKYHDYITHSHICYTVSCAGFRFFELQIGYFHKKSFALAKVLISCIVVKNAVYNRKFNSLFFLILKRK